MFASTWIYLSKFSKVIRPMQRKVCQVTLFFCNMIYWIVRGKLTWIKSLRLQKTGEFSWEWKEEMKILHIVTFITYFNSGWGTCYFTGLIQIRHSLGLLVVQKDDNPLVIAQTPWVCLVHCFEMKYYYWPMKDNQLFEDCSTCEFACKLHLSHIHIYLYNYLSLKFRAVFWPLSVPFPLQPCSTWIEHFPIFVQLEIFSELPWFTLFLFFLSDPNTINIYP